MPETTNDDVVTCDGCGGDVKESNKIECPECGVWKCEDCIAGRHVACFACEEGD